MVLIEQRGKYQLYWYPRNGWALFEFKPTKPDEPDWKTVRNGKWPDVWAEYKKLIDAGKAL